MAVRVWDEAKHPRDPGGEGGGQWVESGASSVAGKDPASLETADVVDYVAGRLGGTVLNYTGAERDSISGKRILTSAMIETPSGATVTLGVELTDYHDRRNRARRVAVLHDFEVVPQRSGVGTRVMEALKGFADDTGHGVAVFQAATVAEPFYARFPWLTGFDEYDPRLSPEWREAHPALTAAYNPLQPRAPAGGPEGGQWLAVGTRVTTAYDSRPTYGTIVDPIFRGEQHKNDVSVEWDDGRRQKHMKGEVRPTRPGEEARYAPKAVEAPVLRVMKGDPGFPPYFPEGVFAPSDRVAYWPKLVGHYNGSPLWKALVLKADPSRSVFWLADPMGQPSHGVMLNAIKAAGGVFPEGTPEMHWDDLHDLSGFGQEPISGGSRPEFDRVLVRHAQDIRDAQDIVAAQESLSRDYTPTPGMAAAAFDESKHRRHPAGTEAGGEWAPRYSVSLKKIGEEMPRPEVEALYAEAEAWEDRNDGSHAEAFLAIREGQGEPYGMVTVRDRDGRLAGVMSFDERVDGGRHIRGGDAGAIDGAGLPLFAAVIDHVATLDLDFSFWATPSAAVLYRKLGFDETSKLYFEIPKEDVKRLSEDLFALAREQRQALAASGYVVEFALVAAFDESKHRRHPAGSDAGGEFAPTHFGPGDPGFPSNFPDGVFSPTDDVAFWPMEIGANPMGTKRWHPLWKALVDRDDPSKRLFWFVDPMGAPHHEQMVPWTRRRDIMGANTFSDSGLDPTFLSGFGWQNQYLARNGPDHPMAVVTRELTSRNGDSIAEAQRIVNEERGPVGLAASAFDPTKHPHEPGGTPVGGRWARKAEMAISEVERKALENGVFDPTADVVFWPKQFLVNERFGRGSPLWKALTSKANPDDIVFWFPGEYGGPHHSQMRRAMRPYKSWLSNEGRDPMADDPWVELVGYGDPLVNPANARFEKYDDLRPARKAVSVKYAATMRDAADIVAERPELALAASAFDPSKHPRHPAGSDRGGEWAPKVLGFGDKAFEGTWSRDPDDLLYDAFDPQVVGPYVGEQGFRVFPEADVPVVKGGVWWKASYYEPTDELKIWVPGNMGGPHHVHVSEAMGWDPQGQLRDFEHRMDIMGAGSGPGMTAELQWWDDDARLDNLAIARLREEMAKPSIQGQLRAAERHALGLLDEQIAASAADPFQVAWEEGQRQAETHFDGLQAAFEKALLTEGRKIVKAYRAANLVAAAEQPGGNTPSSQVIDELLFKQAVIVAARAAQLLIVRSVVLSIADDPKLARLPIYEMLLADVNVVQSQAAFGAVSDSVNRVLLESLTEGWDVPDTAEQLNTVLTDFAPWQATRLARTSLISLANGSSLLAAQALGADAPTFKTWLTAGDELVRPTHVEADRQTVPTDQPFDVDGVPMMFPGDPSAPDALKQNCRCTLVYGSDPHPLLAYSEDWLAPDGELALSAAFDPSKHPRHPGGDPAGGQWANTFTIEDFRHGTPEWRALGKGARQEMRDDPDWKAHLIALTAAGFDELKHPRHPAGSEQGGEFAPRLFTYDDTGAQAAMRAWVDRLNMDAAYTDESVTFLKERLDGTMQTALPLLQGRLDDAGVPVWVSPQLSMDQIDVLANPESSFFPDFDVALGPESSAPGFSVWTYEDGRVEVEDVLDLGDTDFFPGGPESPLAQNYASLVDAAGRTPGAPDTVTLFRGMSPAELDAWKAGEPVPAGKFFTDQPTVNYAQDQAGVFPELQTFEVPRSSVMRTGTNEYQLSQPATLVDGKLVPASRIVAPDPGFYPESQGGHRRGWGLGPEYRIRDDRRPGVVPKPSRKQRWRDFTGTRTGMTAAFDESRHPRHPAGSEAGGRFRSATQPDLLGSARDEAWAGPPIMPGVLTSADLMGAAPISALGRSEQYWRQHNYDVSQLADDFGVTVDGYRDMVAHALQEEAKGDIVIRTPMHGYNGVDPALDIIESGRFKSQMESGVSQGAFAPDIRVMQEKLFFGYPEDLPVEQRPIYGMVDSVEGHDVAHNYGDVLWVLKDDIRTRTTVTGIDSLSRPVVPGPINNPGWRATVPPGYDANVQIPIHDQFADGFAGNPEYVEAQFHGGVSLKDVDHVDIINVERGFPSYVENGVSHSGSEGDKHTVDRLSSLLAPHGITVRAYEDTWARDSGSEIDWTPEVRGETPP